MRCPTCGEEGGVQLLWSVAECDACLAPVPPVATSGRHLVHGPHPGRRPVGLVAWDSWNDRPDDTDIERMVSDLSWALTCRFQEVKYTNLVEDEENDNHCLMSPSCWADVSDTSEYFVLLLED